jgi:hypothetical protein
MDISVLYVVEHISSGMTKIGITENWFSRSTALKINKETKCLGLFSPPELLKAEREVHHKWRNFRLPGSEYFNFSAKQQNALISDLTKKYKVEKDISQIYIEYKLKKTVDVTRCVDASAARWLRLNQRSWHYRISDFCGNNYSDNTLNESAQICSEQIIELASIIADPCGAIDSENRAVWGIAKQIFLADSFSVAKSLFARHRLYNPEKFVYRLKPYMDKDPINPKGLANIIKHHPGKRPLVVRDIEIKSQTVDVLLQHWISCHTYERCEYAMTCLMNPNMFRWYLSNYGPIS